MKTHIIRSTSRTYCGRLAGALTCILPPVYSWALRDPSMCGVCCDRYVTSGAR